MCQAPCAHSPRTIVKFTSSLAKLLATKPHRGFTLGIGCRPAPQRGRGRPLTRQDPRPPTLFERGARGWEWARFPL